MSVKDSALLYKENEMELNIALVVGFVIWCVISIALILVNSMLRRDKKWADEARDTWQENYNSSFYRMIEWKDRYETLISRLGHEATMGGYEPQDDGQGDYQPSGTHLWTGSA